MPSLNEQDSIGDTVKSIPFAALREKNFSVEVLLVDGGSTDKTVKIANDLGVRVVNCSRGYGRQYKLGFQEARGEIIVTGDSDNSYPMHEIPRLIEILEEEGLDFISTNRFAHMAKDSMYWVNNLGNRLLTFLTNLLFFLNLKDSQSGMWVIRKRSLKEIILKSDGMSLSQEIKIEAFKKLRAREVDSSYKKRIGQVKLRIIRDGWGNITHLIKKWLGF